MYSVYTDKKKIKENTFFKIKILQTINERGNLQINKVKTDSECDWSHVSIPCSFFSFPPFAFSKKKERNGVMQPLYTLKQHPTTRPRKTQATVPLVRLVRTNQLSM